MHIRMKSWQIIVLKSNQEFAADRSILGQRMPASHFCVFTSGPEQFLPPY